MNPEEVRRSSMPSISSEELESLCEDIEEPGASAPTGYPLPPSEKPNTRLLVTQGTAWATPSSENEAVCGASPPGVRVVPLPSTKEGRRSSNLKLPSDAALPLMREPKEAEASLSPTRSTPPLQCASSSVSSLGLRQPTAAEPSGATRSSLAPLPAAVAVAPHVTGAASPSTDAVPQPSFKPSTLKIRPSLDARLTAHIHSPTSPAASSSSSAAAASSAFSSSAAASTAATSAAASAATSAAASAASVTSTTRAAFPGQHRQQRAPPRTGAASAETAGEAERAKQRASETARNAAPPSPLRQHEMRRQRQGAWAEDGGASASAPRLRRDLLGHPPQPQPQLHLGPATSALGEGGDTAEAAKRIATEYAKQVGLRIEHEQQVLRAEWRAERAAMRAASLRSLAPASTDEVGGDKVGADEPRAAAPSAAPGGGFGSLSSPRSPARASVGPRDDGTGGGKGEPKRRQAWLATLLKPEHRAHRVGVG